MTAPDSPAADPTPTDPATGPAADPSEQLELKLPDESDGWKDLALWAGVLVLLSLVAYWPSANGPFQWLDGRAVAGDRLLAIPGGMGDVWAGRWQDPARYPFPVYQPVAFAADWAAYRLGGHDDAGLPTPLAYHVLSIAAHALAAVLLWLTLRELVVPAAWLVAAVFALHPVNADAVSWVADGGVPVAGALAFGAAYAYLQYQDLRSRDALAAASGGPPGDPAQTWGLFAAAAVLALAAALALPAAGALPALLLIALWWARRLARPDLLLLVPLGVVTAGLWVANLGLTRHSVPGSTPAVADLGAVRAAAAVGRGFWFALSKSVLPLRLTLIYPPGGVQRSSLAVALLPLAAAVAVVAVAIAAARRGNRGPAAAAVAFALCVAPALNWFDPARHTLMTDAAAYLAVVPLAAAVLAAATLAVHRLRAADEGRTQLVVVASAVLLAVLGATAWVRAHTFDGPVDLWQDTAGKYPGSAFAVAQYAEQLRLRAVDRAGQQDTEGARADLSAAAGEAARAAVVADATGDPSTADPAAATAAQRTWAAVLVATGDVHAALAHFALATAGPAGPADAATLVDYGQALLTLGDFPAAVRQLDRALAADPSSGAAHRVLGQAYHKLGDDPRTLREEQQATDINPLDLAAQELLAGALNRAGRPADALAHYIVIFQADRTTQNRADLWAAIGRIKDQQGAYNDAVTYLTQARQLDAKLPDIDADLAGARGRLAKAAATRPAMTQPTTAPAADGPLGP